MEKKEELANEEKEIVNLLEKKHFQKENTYSYMITDKCGYNNNKYLNESIYIKELKHSIKKLKHMLNEAIEFKDLIELVFNKVSKYINNKKLFLDNWEMENLSLRGNLNNLYDTFIIFDGIDYDFDIKNFEKFIGLKEEDFNVSYASFIVREILINFDIKLDPWLNNFMEKIKNMINDIKMDEFKKEYYSITKNTNNEVISIEEFISYKYIDIERVFNDLSIEKIRKIKDIYLSLKF